jgi:glucose uptake protein
MIWMIGALCSFTAASTPAAAKVPASAAYVLGQGSPLIAALCGLLIWREFKGAGFNVKMMLVVMLVLFMAGLGLISIAPLHAS